MKTHSAPLLLACLFLMSFSMEAQITKRPVKKPTINTGVSSPVGLPTPYDEILRDLENGKCYSIALTSLQLNPLTSAKTNHNAETRDGIGALSKDGKNLKASFDIEAGVNENGSRRILRTTIKLTRSRSGISLDIRNSQYFHLIHLVKIVKKENGYYITTERDEASATVSFTLAIFKTTCLI